MGPSQGVIAYAGQWLVAALTECNGVEMVWYKSVA